MLASPLSSTSPHNNNDLTRSQKLKVVVEEGLERKRGKQYNWNACVVCYLNQGNASRNKMCYPCWMLVDPSMAFPSQESRKLHTAQLSSHGQLYDRMKREEASIDAGESSIDKLIGSWKQQKEDSMYFSPLSKCASQVRVGRDASASCWICGACTFENDSASTVCELCNTPAPDQAAIPGGGWECQHCGWHDTDSEGTRCHTCGTWREWTCSVCTLLNLCSNVECTACGAKWNPAEAAAGGGAADALRQEMEIEKQRTEDILEGRKRLDKRLQAMECVEQVMTDDGNCQFRALSFQLWRTQRYHSHLRAIVIEHMKHHRQDYDLFFESAAEFDEYLDRMARVTTWGDEMTLRAISDAIGLTVYIAQSEEGRWILSYEPTNPPGSRTFQMYDGDGAPPLRAFLSYQAPVHYNSILPRDSRDTSEYQFLVDSVDCELVEQRVNIDELMRLEDQCGQESRLASPVQKTVQKALTKIEQLLVDIQRYGDKGKAKAAEYESELRTLKGCLTGGARPPMREPSLYSTTGRDGLGSISPRSFMSKSLRMTRSPLSPNDRSFPVISCEALDVQSILSDTEHREPLSPIEGYSPTDSPSIAIPTITVAEGSPCHQPSSESLTYGEQSIMTVAVGQSPQVFPATVNDSFSPSYSDDDYELPAANATVRSTRSNRSNRSIRSLRSSLGARGPTRALVVDTVSEPASNHSSPKQLQQLQHLQQTHSSGVQNGFHTTPRDYNPQSNNAAAAAAAFDGMPHHCADRKRHRDSSRNTPPGTPERKIRRPSAHLQMPIHNFKYRETSPDAREHSRTSSPSLRTSSPPAHKTSPVKKKKKKSTGGGGTTSKKAQPRRPTTGRPPGAAPAASGAAVRTQPIARNTIISVGAKGAQPPSRQPSPEVTFGAVESVGTTSVSSSSSGHHGNRPTVAQYVYKLEPKASEETRRSYSTSPLYSRDGAAIATSPVAADLRDLERDLFEAQTHTAEKAAAAGGGAPLQRTPSSPKRTVKSASTTHTTRRSSNTASHVSHGSLMSPKRDSTVSKVLSRTQRVVSMSPAHEPAEAPPSYERPTRCYQERKRCSIDLIKSLPKEVLVSKFSRRMPPPPRVSLGGSMSQIVSPKGGRPPPSRAHTAHPAPRAGGSGRASSPRQRSSDASSLAKHLSFAKPAGGSLDGSYNEHPVRPLRRVGTSPPLRASSAVFPRPSRLGGRSSSAVFSRPVGADGGSGTMRSVAGR